jgi:hypothetical protein
VDSRFRGNDWRFETAPLPNDDNIALRASLYNTFKRVHRKSENNLNDNPQMSWAQRRQSAARRLPEIAAAMAARHCPPNHWSDDFDRISEAGLW